MISHRTHSDWQGTAKVAAMDKARRPQISAYETSLVSEYARLLLLLVVIPLLIVFLQIFANHQTGLLALGATLTLTASLITPRGNPVLRLIVLSSFAINIAAMMLQSGKVIGSINISPVSELNGILLLCLVAACCFESIAWFNSLSSTAFRRVWVWGLLAIPVLIYVIGLPLWETLQVSLEGGSEKLTTRDPNWNLANEFAFRAAKFLIFAAFTFLGACLGSFLNVVASSAPRGETVTWRDSCCPQCDSKISRFDNIPFFSYINLGGECRSCHCPIPIRYLLVECAVAGIFGSLFLYELVTGAANIPTVNIRHTGILWIILYPKWQIIGMYFLHVFYMSFILVLALIEWDEQPLKVRFWLPVSAVFFITTLVFLPIQPVPLFDHLPELTSSLSPWLEQLLKLLAGSLLGVAIGVVWNKVLLKKPSTALTIAFLLTGMVLGWQALIQVTLLFGLFYGTSSLLFRNSYLSRQCPATVLLVTILIHHPLWKILAAGWGWAA
ncbi:MAG: prepilin peptidase [Pirellulaceae bacterium]|nr:prepilin peptidase [Pirellulaceae bacterium]